MTGFVQQKASADEARRLAIHLLFRSPDFIFHFEAGATSEAERVRLTEHEVANRVSYALTGAPPDAQLAAAADAGQLKTLAQVDSHARRILATQAARPKIDRFYSDWLQLSRVKIPVYQYQEWLLGLGKVDGMDARYRREIMDYVGYTTWKKNGNFADLMTQPIAFPRESGINYDVNRPWSIMAGIYTNDPYNNYNPENTNDPSPYPAPENPGLVMRAGFLAAGRMNSDPIGRGVFLMRRILCAPLPTPDFTVINQRLQDPAALDPVKMANHEIVASKTSATSCMSCHSQINPLGFALEGFDPLGKARKRETVYDMSQFYAPNRAVVAEHALPYPVSSVNLGDKTVSVSSATDLANALASSKTAQTCMATFVIRHFDRRKENIGDSCALEEAQQTLAQGKPLIELFVKSIANEDVFWRKK